MQAPHFWSRPPRAPGWQARALAPLSWLWTARTRRRMARGGARLPVPVICVGNLTAGGAGKTPTVIALAQHLTGMGRAVRVISRGHGGRLTGPVRVDPARHGADDVGDEPLLIAPFAPIWIGRDRAAAGRAAVEDGAEVIVMDDGFQNPSLVHDRAIVVIDAEAGFGNGRVLPAGPLREPVADGLARADALTVIGPEPARARLLGAWPVLGRLPMATGRLVPLATGMDWAGQRVLAFAGIGRPEKFFASLEAAGAEIVARRAFADHAPYEARILARLAAEARGLGAQLVTTEKDMVRLPAAFRAQTAVFPVRLEIEGIAALGLDALVS